MKKNYDCFQEGKYAIFVYVIFLLDSTIFDVLSKQKWPSALISSCNTFVEYKIIETRTVLTRHTRKRTAIALTVIEDILSYLQMR